MTAVISEELENELREWLESIVYVNEDGTEDDMDDFGEDTSDDPEGDRGDDEEPPVTAFVPHPETSEE